MKGIDELEIINVTITMKKRWQFGLYSAILS